MGMLLVNAGSLFCAEHIVSKTPKELRDALHAAKTVEEAQRLIDLKADVLMPRLEEIPGCRVYTTLLQSVALNFKNDPKLINFVASRGITTQWGEKRITPESEFWYPLFYRFVEGVGSEEIESRPLDQLKNRVKNLMEEGVLISSPGIRKGKNVKEPICNPEVITRRLKDLLDSSFSCTSPNARRYAVTLAQTIHETGQALSVQRKTLKGELPNILLQLPTVLINQVIFEYLYPCKIFDKEEIELAKVKALLDERNESDQKKDGEKSKEVIGLTLIDSHISPF